MHILLTATLILVLIALTDPFMYWMPETAAMAALVAAAGVVAILAGLVIKENGGDERDHAHRSLAGRMGYVAGLGILTCALLVQGFTHTLDPWIPLTLGVMVVAKTATRWFADRYR